MNQSFSVGIILIKYNVANIQIQITYMCGTHPFILTDTNGLGGLSGG